MARYESNLADIANNVHNENLLYSGRPASNNSHLFHRVQILIEHGKLSEFQSFCAALHEELAEYMRLLGVLDAQVKTRSV